MHCSSQVRYDVRLMFVKLTISFGFEAAHFLPNFPEGHKCRRMHGHSFKVEVTVAGDIPEGQGHLLDFGEVKQAIAPIEERLDHHLLNEIEGLEDPTSEQLAGWIWDRLAPNLPLLNEVVVRETCRSMCTYLGPQM